MNPAGAADEGLLEENDNRRSENRLPAGLVNLGCDLRDGSVRFVAELLDRPSE